MQRRLRHDEKKLTHGDLYVHEIRLPRQRRGFRTLKNYYKGVSFYSKLCIFPGPAQGGRGAYPPGKEVGAMHITSRGRYALRLMVELAQQDGRDYVPLKFCAQRQGISIKYLEAIARTLRTAGLLESGRGKEGGYRLSRAPGAYSAGEILRCIEDDLAPVSCIREGACDREGDCRTKPFWRELDSVMNRYLDDVTLGDLVSGERWSAAASPKDRTQ